jgi:hypothetical protein
VGEKLCRGLRLIAPTVGITASLNRGGAYDEERETDIRSESEFRQVYSFTASFIN